MSIPMPDMEGWNSTEKAFFFKVKDDLNAAIRSVNNYVGIIHTEQYCYDKLFAVLRIIQSILRDSEDKLIQTAHKRHFKEFVQACDLDDANTAIKKMRSFLDKFPANDKMNVSQHTTVNVEDIKALRAAMPEE